jgi:hypothetical protein
LVLFVRNGAFQQVTAEKIKKILSPFSSPAGVMQDAGSVPRVSKGIARVLFLEKQLLGILILAAAPPIPARPVMR